LKKYSGLEPFCVGLNPPQAATIENVPLSDGGFSFSETEWHAKKMTLKQAAEACNMPVGTFYDKARKFENTA